MRVHPSELPLVEDEPRCPSCTYHEDAKHPTKAPAAELIPAGAVAVYEGAGHVPGPHFRRRCRHCGAMWPEGVVPD